LCRWWRDGGRETYACGGFFGACAGCGRLLGRHGCFVDGGVGILNGGLSREECRRKRVGRWVHTLILGFLDLITGDARCGGEGECGSLRREYMR
jgi:hypothetical protein